MLIPKCCSLLLSTETQLGVSSDHLSLPKLGSQQISRHDGIGGLSYTQSQVAIAYESA
jgi:hypothetical protein